MQNVQMLYSLWRANVIQHSPVLKHGLQSTFWFSLGSWLVKAQLLIPWDVDCRNPGKEPAPRHI